MNSPINTVTAREVPESERLYALPRHFGEYMLAVESAVYAFMGRLARQYSGGYWKFLELSNGGFYMTPEGDQRFSIRVEGNDYEGEMSADAAGIIACLFALSHLSFQIDSDRIAEHYHLLLEFASDHAEARQILAAID